MNNEIQFAITMTLVIVIGFVAMLGLKLGWKGLYLFFRNIVVKSASWFVETLWLWIIIGIVGACKWPSTVGFVLAWVVGVCIAVLVIVVVVLGLIELFMYFYTMVKNGEYAHFGKNAESSIPQPTTPKPQLNYHGDNI